MNALPHMQFIEKDHCFACAAAWGCRDGVQMCSFTLPIHENHRRELHALMILAGGSTQREPLTKVGLFWTCYLVQTLKTKAIRSAVALNERAAGAALLARQVCSQVSYHLPRCPFLTGAAAPVPQDCS